MTERMRRVNESVRAVITEAIGGLHDPRIGFVTVTGVTVSPDLHDARVYISVLGNDKRRIATMAGLESARGVIQGRLARELRMTKLIDELAPEGPSDDAPAASDAD